MLIPFQYAVGWSRVTATWYYQQVFTSPTKPWIFDKILCDCNCYVPSETKCVNVAFWVSPRVSRDYVSRHENSSAQCSHRSNAACSTLQTRKLKRSPATPPYFPRLACLVA